MPYHKYRYIMRHVFVGFVFHSPKLQDFLPYSLLSLSLSLSLYLSLVWEFQTHGAKIPRNSMPYRVVPVCIYIWQAQSMSIKVFICFSFIKKPRGFTKQTYLKVYLKVQIYYLKVITLMPCYLIIPYYGLLLKQLDWITLNNNIWDFHYCYVEVLRC